MFWSVVENGGVVHARFTNGERNYYTDAAVTELAEHVERWRDPSVRAVILSGGLPGIFITHFDPEQVRSSILNEARTREFGPERNAAVNRVLTGLTELRAVTIAAMNGDTMGFGLELALACDLRVGERGDYRYGFPEVRMGVIPGSGGGQRLSRLCGLAMALDLVVTSRLLTPEEALVIGMVTRLGDDAEALAAEIAARVVQLPAVPVALAKRALYNGADASLPASLVIESDASTRSKLGPAASAAVDEYLAVPVESRRDWLEG